MRTLFNKWALSTAFVIMGLSLIGGLVFYSRHSGVIYYRNYVFPWIMGSVLLTILSVLVGAVCARAETLRSAMWESIRQPQVPILVLMLFFIAYGLTPQVPNILFDETIFMSIAQTFSKSGMLAACHQGRIEGGGFACYAYEYYKQPPGFPFYLSIFYRMFGSSASLAALANLLTLPIAFVAGIVFLQDLGWTRRRSLLAMGLYVTTPLVMHWSGTAALEPFSVASTLVALAVTGRWLKTGDAWLGAAAAAALAWAMMSRLESVLLISGGLLLLGPTIRSRLSSIGRSQITLFCSLLFLFTVPLFLQMYLFREDPWGASESRFALKYFWPNLKVNGSFLYKNDHYPIWITLTAALAVLTARPRYHVWSILGWFLASYVIYLFFYAGSYEYGMDARFSIPSSLPLALLSAIYLDRWAEAKSAPSSLLLAVPLLQLVWFAPVIRNVQTQPQSARDSILFSETYLKTLPPDSIVFTHVPSVPLLRNQNAALLHFIDHDEAAVRHFFERYSGGVYMDWTYWCATTEDYRKNCQRIADRFDSEVVQSMTRDRLEFKLIRLRLKKSTKI